MSASESEILEALRVWRSAEVHQAAVFLDLRDGDETEARDAVERATRALRIVADKAVKGERDMPHAGPGLISCARRRRKPQPVVMCPASAIK